MQRVHETSSSEVGEAPRTHTVAQGVHAAAYGGALRDQLLRMQRGAGNRATALVARQLAPRGSSRRLLQRVTYSVATPVAKPGSEPPDPLWVRIGETIKDWASYSRRAQQHLETLDPKPPDYASIKERLDAHVRLAGVFEGKYEPRHLTNFVVVNRDGVIGALIIAEERVNNLFLDDLWSNPRKAFALTEGDRAAVRGDLSGAAAMEHVIKWAHRLGKEIRLLGGDRSAREFYWKNYGFGVRVNQRRPGAKGGPRDPMDYGRHHAIEVNPQEGTTERDMVLPVAGQAQYLSDLYPALSGPTSSWRAWENSQKGVTGLL